MIAVHLKGHFAPTRWAAAYWREEHKAGRGRRRNLVHTSSTSGLFSNPGQSNYGAAKSGIATFSQIVAKELTRYDVVSNCIAPGARTRLTLATPGLGEIIAAKEGAFDEWDPANVSPLVAYLEQRSVRVHRRDVLRPGWRRQAGRVVGDGGDVRTPGDVDGRGTGEGARRIVSILNAADEAPDGAVVPNWALTSQSAVRLCGRCDHTSVPRLSRSSP